MVALFAPLLAPRDSLFISSRALRQSTSWWTTALGEDIFWQLLQPLGRVLSGQVWLETQDLARLSPDALRRTRWREFSVVFQASMNVLNPVTRMREQIYDPLRAHAQMDKAALARRAEELFALIDIDPNYLDAYPHRLLGGMKQRVVIAIALVLEPDLLIMDEPTTALDVVVQRTPLQESDRVRRTLGISVIFIIHDLAGAHYISDRTAVMYAGRLVKVGPSTALIYSPKHPYPQLLRRAAPKPETGLEPERVHAKGELDVAAPPVSCPFAHEASLA